MKAWPDILAGTSFTSTDQSAGILFVPALLATTQLLTCETRLTRICVAAACGTEAPKVPDKFKSRPLLVL